MNVKVADAWVTVPEISLEREDEDMKIEVGKEYKVLASALGFKKGDIIGVVDEDVDNKDNFCIVINRFENRRTPKKYIQMLDLENYEDAFTESTEEMESRELDDGENKVSEYQEVNVGYAYRCISNVCGIGVGSLVEVLSVKRGIVKVLSGNNHINRIEKGDFLGGFTLVGKVEHKDGSAGTKPAHYDTAIDTIAFAKANFTPEQVEGFMRINAIKYLQRVKKGQVLEDLKKSRSYIDMLIEMEEGK